MTGSTTNTDTSPRLFVAATLREGEQIAASSGQAHYLGTVLRRVSGDLVRLFNGSDGEWSARLTVAKRDRVTLSVQTMLRAPALESGPWLVFALLKRDATDLVVRQAVELGASRLLPVMTERTNAARVNQERLLAIATEAAEQCERLTVPAIDPPARLDDVLTAWPARMRLFVAIERTWTGTPQAVDRGSGDRARDIRQTGPVGLLIGPEGGFTPSERSILSQLPFVTPISLGPFVLRAETASVAGLALLLTRGSDEYAQST